MEDAMGKFVVAAAATLLLWPAASFAQKSMPPMPQMGQDMGSAMAAAQAAAKQQGDENLSCEALQEQMITSVNNPAVKTVVAKQGAQAQAQVEKLNAAQSSQSKASVAAQVAQGFAASLVPGFGAAQMAAAAAQAQGQVAQAAANQQQMMANMQDLMTIMPHMMRGQRLYELAAGKNCAWLSGPPPGGVR
jgi:hypothetical protein